MKLKKYSLLHHYELIIVLSLHHNDVINELAVPRADFLKLYLSIFNLWKR